MFATRFVENLESGKGLIAIMESLNEFEKTKKKPVRLTNSVLDAANQFIPKIDR